MVTRGFTGRGPGGDQSDRIPPGQHLVENFPVLTAGPTPSVEPSDWKFTVKIGPKPVKVWNWSEFNALPKTKMTRDIHCVTSWSKLDTAWEGVLIEDILADAGLDRPTDFVLAHCYDNYSTNVPLADLLSGKAMVALNYAGKPLPRDHGVLGIFRPKTTKCSGGHAVRGLQRGITFLALHIASHNKSIT
ncbi:Oxidoreductase molybdopterin binding domain protein (plasmid) [Aeromonas rivipollensis]|uniref:molybdopterin-dependent oxidoreductase n=1 Tax=Aeromonas rivipollensis TaxID=948519 RepID=UPI00399D4EA2